MAIIDAHHHLWDLGAVRYPWLMARGERRFFGDPTPIQRNYLLPDFRRDHGGAPVVASVHVQVGAADALSETRWLARHADAAGWPLAIVAFADLTDAGLPDSLDSLTAVAGGRLRGVRQIVARHPAEDGPAPGALLGDPRFAAGLRLLAARGLSFDLQLTAPLLRRAAALLADVPGLRVALCHAGSPWDMAAMADWRAGLRAMARVPGVVAKLSGLGMLRPDGRGIEAIVDGVLAAFPPERVMLGSNVPVDALARPWTVLLDQALAAVPAAARAAVVHDTACDFYRLSPLITAASESAPA